ncbi:MAG: ComF family protein [Spirochaetales bacterium]|nr:ComF family protein [Spirochaetales bacterium]
MKSALFLRILSDLVLPQHCAGCGDALLFNRGSIFPVCANCITKIKRIKGKRCPVCSIDLVSEDDICTRCRDKAFYFRKNVSLFVFSGLIKELIYQYKFKKVKPLAHFFVRELFMNWQSYNGNTVVVPVPSRPRKGLRKNFMHLEYLSGILKKTYKINIRNLLGRLPGRQMKGLTREGRQLNISGRILLKSLQADLPESVILLDDIFTTGATANECARVLTDAGVKQVDVFTIAMEY